MHKIHHFRFLTLLVFLFVVACDKASTDLEPKLINAELVKTYLKADFKNEIEINFGSVAKQASALVQYDLKQYRVVYNTTDPQGNEVRASGVLVVPVAPVGQISLASFQHGTLFNEADAPSYFGNSSEVFLGSFFASTGMAVVIPDYLGYGESKNIAHPYEHRAGLAIPNVDFLKAAKEFMDSNALEWTGRTLLAGYSEGGYATMATHKYLEDELSKEFPVTVSVCGAGAYNKTLSFDKIINEPSSGNVGHNRSYIWVLLTYIENYKLSLKISDVFKQPYADKITANRENVTIEVSLHETIRDDFKADLKAGKYPQMKEALADNDVHNWRPKAIVRLYHGDADEYVPYYNSTSAIEAMLRQGTTDIELRTVKGGTHGSSISDFIFGVLELFLTYK